MRRNHSLYLVAALIVAVMTLLAGGCATEQEEIAPVKIGSTLGLTGPASSITRPALDGVRMAAEEVNARGGLVYGGEAHPVVVIAYDGKWDASATTKATRKLVFEDKVDLIIQEANSAANLAAQEITEPNKVISFSLGWAKELLAPDKPYSFRIAPTCHETGWALWKWCREKGYPEARTMASIGPDYITSREYAENDQKPAVAHYGFEMIADELYPKGTSDFYPMLTRILEREPDIIELNSGGPDVYPLIKQARELGYWGPIVTVGTQPPATAIEMCGAEAAEGYTAQGFVWTAEGVLPIAKDFYEKCVDRYGGHTNQNFGYEAAWFYFQAVEGADSVAADDIREYFETETLQGLWGDCYYGGESYYGINHQMISPVGIIGVVNGKIVQLYVGPPELE